MKYATLLLALIVLSNSFTFLYPFVTPAALTINSLTSYGFQALRQFDINLGSTPYASQLVPAGSSITVIFPSEYVFTTQVPTVTSLLINGQTATFNFSVTSNNVTITDSITTDTAIANVTINVGNVLNPYPAVTTNPFIIVIGNDISSSSSSSSVTLTAGNFAACSVTFNPATVNTTGAMEVAVTPTNKILQNDYIQIFFPQTLQWSEDISLSHSLPLGSALSCPVLSGSVLTGSCSGNTATASISFTISSINGTEITNAFSFSVSSLFSPPTTTPPDTLQIKSFSSSNSEIDTCTTTITGLQPQTLTFSVAGSSNPLYINSGTFLILTFTLTDTISKNDYFQLVFPPGTTFTFLAVSTINLSIFSSLVSYISANQTLVMRQAASSSTRYAGTICTIRVGRYTSPSSTLAATPFIFQVYNQQNGLKMQGQTSLAAQAKPYAMTITPTSYLINEATSYTFDIVITDTVLSSGMIDITFPSQLALSVVSNCLSSNNFTSPASPQCQQTSQTVRISSISSADISPNTYSFTIQTVTNADRALTTSSFSFTVYYSNNVSAKVGENTVSGITMQPKELNTSQINVLLSSNVVSATAVTANVSFIPLDAVPATGYITVTYPPEIAFMPNYLPQCELHIGVSTTIPQCSLNGTTLTVPLGSQTLAAGQTVIVTLKSFGTNPPNTQPTGFFSIYTYSSGNYLIDFSNNTYIFNNFQPASYQALTLIASSQINSASTSYTLTIQHTNTWGIGSYLIVDLPSTVSLATPTCLDINNNNAALTCAMVNTSQLKIDLPGNGSLISVDIASPVNPSSLRPTSTFTVSTYSSLGYLYATDNSSLSLTMTTASQFSSFSYQFSNLIYNTSSNLTLTMGNNIGNTDTYTISPFSQFSSSPFANISCTSPSFALTCSISGDFLSITPTNPSDLFPSNTTIEILDLFIPVSNTTTMTIQSFQGTYLVSSNNNIHWQPQCTLPCMTCSSTNSSVCLSCFTTTAFTNRIYFYQQNCYTACPTSTFAPTNSLICTTCTDPCSSCSQIATNCTECNQSSSTPILDTTTNTCIASCQPGQYVNNNSNATTGTPVCSTCVSPCATCTSPTICITCANSSLFYYNMNCITTCPSLITVANTTTMICEPCDPSCLTCQNSTITCLTCNTAIAPFYVSSTGTCQASCPSPLVPDSSTTCASCQYPCLTCFLNKTNCTSCQSGTYLSFVTINTCVTSCQQFYFANATSNQCVACSSIPNLNCSNCFNETYCISCDSGFVLFLVDHTCPSVVPSGYVNISGIATACTSNCAQCAGGVSNCTLCTGNYSLYVWLGGGQCLLNCPSGTLSINNTCVNCISPCISCSIQLINCTSCLTGYLYYNSSTTYNECPAVCPDGTFINATAVACQNCISPCKTCIGGQSTCATCLSGYLYNSTCIVSCPSNTLVDNVSLTCTDCVSPCLTCSGTTNNCTACVSLYYYYAPLFRCYSTCPADISVNDTTSAFLSCASCDVTCQTCSVLATNCTSCPQGTALYNFTCLSNCVTGFYSFGGICQPCTSTCTTCITLSTTCTSCSGTLYLYQSACISTCPVTHGYIVNNTCTACSASCLNCSSVDFCYECPTTSALYNGACVTSCPSPLTFHYNTSSASFNCYTADQLRQQTLQDSLQVSSIFPLPFTILTTFFFLCCLMSKLQFVNTYALGIGYSLYGCSQTGALIYLISVYDDYSNSTDYSTIILLLWICMGIILTLNCISLVMVTPCLVTDDEFYNWLNHRKRGSDPKQKDEKTDADQKQTQNSADDQIHSDCCSHMCSFVFFTIFGLIINFKCKLLMFTKLFRFSFLTAQLEDIHGFRIFNVLSFLALIYQCLYFYTAVKLFSNFSFGNDNQLMFAIIDLLTVVCISMLFSLLTTYKQPDFFRVQEEKDFIDLGKQKKKYAKDPKNMKIDGRRMAGLDSHDKLIDLDESLSMVSEKQKEEVIVNHNIDSKIMPSKVSNLWVERTTPMRTRSKSPKNKKKDRNIFQIDEQDELPFEAKDSYSPRERIQLFHTSIKPADSRVSDWNDSRFKQRLKTHELQNSFIENNALSKSEILETNRIRNNLGINSSIVRVDMDGVGSSIKKSSVSRPPIKHFILTDSEVLPQTQNPALVGAMSGSSMRNPVIKETESENMNTSQKNTIKTNRIDIIPEQNVNVLVTEPQTIKNKQSNKVELEDMQGLNKTIQEGQILSDSKNRSFQSVLPFVHEDGILKDKNKAKKQQQEKIIYPKKVAASAVDRKPVKVETGVVANSYFIKQQIKKKQEQEQKKKQQKQQIEELLEMSDIKQKPQSVSNKQDVIVKNKPKLGFMSAHYNQIYQPQKKLKEESMQGSQSQLQKSRSKAELASTQQLNQKIEPQNKPNTPVVHAPKVFSRTNLASGDVLPQIEEIEEFDLKLNEKQAYLRNIKQTVEKNNQRAVMKDEKDKTSRRRSKKSLASQFQTAYLKGKQKNGDHLIIEQQHQSQYVSSNKEADDLQEIQIEPDSKSAYKSEWKEQSKPPQISRNQYQAEGLTPASGVQSSSQDNIFNRKRQSYEQYIEPQQVHTKSQSHFEKQNSNVSISQESSKNSSEKEQLQSQNIQNKEERQSLQKEGEPQSSHVQSSQKSVSYRDGFTQIYTEQKNKPSISEYEQQSVEEQEHEQLDPIHQKQEISSKRQSTPASKSRRKNSVSKEEISSKRQSTPASRSRRKSSVSQKQNFPEENQQNKIPFLQQRQPQLYHEVHISQQYQEEIVSDPQTSKKRYEIQQKQNDYYEQEQKSIKNSQLLKNRQPKQNQNLRPQHKPQPAFILEQEQKNLTDEESDSKDYTMANQNANPSSQLSKKANVSSIQLKKTNKNKAKSPSNTDKKKQYKSPFVFSKTDQVMPSQLPIDSEMGIENRQKRSLVRRQKPTQSRQSEQKPPSQERSHEQIKYLLNNAQRNSRSKKKLPKQEKDQRIAIKLDTQRRTPFSQQRNSPENNNLTRKSVQKNKPISSNFTLRKDNQDYEEEEQPRSYRQPVIVKNSTAAYLPPKQTERSSRVNEKRSNSTFQLYQKEAHLPEIGVKFPKKQQRHEQVRQFNFGDQMSSQISGNNYNSEAEMVKWKQNFVKESRPNLPNIQPAYQSNNMPNQPYIHNLEQLDEYEEDEADEVPHPRSKQKSKRHKSKHRKRNPKKKGINDLEKIYGH